MTPDTVLERLDGAVERGEFHFQFQPTVDLSTGAVAGVEALLRWDEPTLGTISPGLFVPLAETHGHIGAITRWGLGHCFEKWRQWSDAGLDIRLAFNISAVSLCALDFPDIVEASAREHGVACNRLTLELTEGATQPLITLLDTLGRFRIKGIGLAIDDFGVGYSGLRQLRELPFTDVKIDRFFVADMVEHPHSRAIVEAIIRIARSLDLRVIAEGIETDAQLLLLADMGCDMGQGFGISRPLDPDAVPDFAAEWPQRWAALQS